MRAAIGLASLLIAGCATTWDNPRYTTDARQERMFGVANNRCELVAAGRSPMPDVYVADPAVETTYIAGDIRDRYGQRTGGFQGTATTYNGNAFASGLASGLSIGNAMAARKARTSAHDACMGRMGWRKDGRALW